MWSGPFPKHDSEFLGLVFGETLIGWLLAITSHYSVACGETSSRICLLAVYGAYIREFLGLGFSILGIAPFSCTLVQGVAAFGAPISDVESFIVSFLRSSLNLVLSSFHFVSAIGYHTQAGLQGKGTVSMSVPTPGIVVDVPPSSALSRLTRSENLLNIVIIRLRFGRKATGRLFASIYLTTVARKSISRLTT
ncbi:uncharacterized protein BDV14DRAFT_183621 [Aspergillus stella-maris]|uniref:uncharacterized protein n=1 Tax=Aspergillus stella-maris TaxID=1810926 RepID=UPI003CCD5EB2